MYKEMDVQTMTAQKTRGDKYTTAESTKSTPHIVQGYGGTSIRTSSADNGVVFMSCSSSSIELFSSTVSSSCCDSWRVVISSWQSFTSRWFVASFEPERVIKLPVKPQPVQQTVLGFDDFFTGCEAMVLLFSFCPVFFAIADRVMRLPIAILGGPVENRIEGLSGK